MNEHFKQDAFPAAPQQDESDVVALVKKIQQQLVFLEKKIDTLISQSSERPFKGKYFSKPFRPLHGRQPGFGHSHHHGKGGHKDSREGGFTQGRHFDKQQGGENQGFGQRKKPFFRRRKDRS